MERVDQRGAWHLEAAADGRLAGAVVQCRNDALHPFRIKCGWTATLAAPAPCGGETGRDPLLDQRPLILSERPEEVEQELAMRRVGVDRLGERAECDASALQLEFQPSGWSKGSYLNAGAHWLWRHEPGPITFDYNDRVEGFISFESGEQFEPEADRLATRAAKEALKLEGIFGSITETAQVLTNLVMAGRTGWSTYNAAVAA